MIDKRGDFCDSGCNSLFFNGRISCKFGGRFSADRG